MKNDPALSRRNFIKLSGAGVLGLELIKSGGGILKQ